MSKTYAFTGATGCRNRGVEALIATAIIEIRRRDANARIGVVSTDRDYDVSVFGSTVEVLKDNPGYFRMPEGRRTLRYAFGYKTPETVREIRRLISSADVIIATGGDIFSSDYGVGFLRRHLRVLNEAQAAGKKTVFLAHSIGPFRTKVEVDMIRPVLEKSALVTVRESFSRNYLVEELKLSPDKVVLTADVAFLMEPADIERVSMIKQIVGLPADKPYIALAPSEGITSFETSEGIYDHDGAWIGIVEHLLSLTDAHIVLLPHVQDLNLKNDDSQIISRLIARIGSSSRVHAAFGPYSAMDYKGLVKGAELLIGERMHACIAGLSQNVPTLTIGYSVKAAGIMDDLLGDEATKRKLLIPVQDFRAGEALYDGVSAIWRDRAEIRELLSAATPIIKDRAEENFRLLAKI